MTDPRLTEAVARMRGELEHWDSPGFDDAEVRVRVGTLRTLLAALDAMTAERDGARQAVHEVVGCCQAAERDALRWIYVLHNGDLGLDEDGNLCLGLRVGASDDAEYLTQDEVDEVSGNKPDAKGWIRGAVLNRAIDHVRGETAIGLPPAPPCIHERQLATLRARLERAEAAINWACGADDSDFAEPENAKRYWWRKELHTRAGLTYDPTQSRYVFDAARGAPQGGTTE